MNKTPAGTQNTPVIALHYSEKTSDSVVLRDGKLLSQHLTQIAHQHGIAHTLDPALAASMARTSLHPDIPDDLYTAAAQVLAFVWSTTQSS